MNMMEDESEVNGTALHAAVCRNDVRAAWAALVAGADIDGVDGEGRTPLFLAVEQRHEVMTRVLLKAGARQSRTTRFGTCALHEAVRLGSVEFVRMLLERQLRYPLPQQVRGSHLYCGRHELHESPLNVASRLLVTETYGTGPSAQGSITSLLLAAGACVDELYELPEDIGYFSAYEDDDQEADRVRQQQLDDAVVRRRCAVTQAALENAGFALVRNRLLEVAKALASFDFPALIIYMILEEACAPPGVCLRMHHVWQVAVAVKHLPRKH